MGVAACRGLCLSILTKPRARRDCFEGVESFGTQGLSLDRGVAALRITGGKVFEARLGPWIGKASAL